MKIIIVNKFFYIKGGSETYCFALAESLQKRGHEVHFFSMKDDQNNICDDQQFFVSNRDYNSQLDFSRQIDNAVNLIWSREARDKFQRLCECVKPDIIHLNLVHRQITLSILDAPYLQEHPVPIVYTAHEYISVCPNYTLLDGHGRICEKCLQGNYLHCIARRCVKNSYAKSALAAIEAEFIKHKKYYSKIDLVIAPSHFLERKLVESRQFQGRVIKLQNFLPDSMLNEIVNVSEDVQREEGPYFLYLGRLSKEKGLEDLITAYSNYCNCTLNHFCTLKIVGAGPLRKKLEEMAVSLRVSKYIRFEGFLSGMKLRRLVKGSAFSIMPSTWYENMPYSGLESLASGVPVIGASIGGIPEFVINDKTGILFKAGNTGSLEKALLHADKILSNPEEYEKMRVECRRYIENNCLQNAYIDRLLNIYQSLIDSK